MYGTYYFLTESEYNSLSSQYNLSLLGVWTLVTKGARTGYFCPVGDYEELYDLPPQIETLTGYLSNQAGFIYA